MNVAAKQCADEALKNFKHGIENFEMEVNTKLDRPSFWQTFRKEMTDNGLDFEITEKDTAWSDHYYYMHLYNLNNDLDEGCNESTDFGKTPEDFRNEKLDDIDFIMYKYVQDSRFGIKIVADDQDGNYRVSYEGEVVDVSFDTDSNTANYVYTINDEGPYEHNSYEFISSDIIEFIDGMYNEEDLDESCNMVESSKCSAEIIGHRNYDGIHAFVVHSPIFNDYSYINKLRKVMPEYRIDTTGFNDEVAIFADENELTDVQKYIKRFNTKYCEESLDESLKEDIEDTVDVYDLSPKEIASLIKDMLSKIKFTPVDLEPSVFNKDGKETYYLVFTKVCKALGSNFLYTETNYPIEISKAPILFRENNRGTISMVSINAGRIWKITKNGKVTTEVINPYSKKDALIYIYNQLKEFDE